MISQLQVSIITPSFNQGRYIEETIASVLGQTYGNIEYIVIDGGSTDDTTDILKKFDGRITWTSESDHGQGDAVNKGFKMAGGEILGWINSDDTYTSDAVAHVVRYFAHNPDIVMVYGEAFHVDGAGEMIKPYPTEPFSLKRLARTCFICQPSVFIRKEVFQNIGPLDTGLQTAMDYDYWCRIGRRYGEKKIGYLHGTMLAYSRFYDDGKTLRLRKIVFHEAMRIQRKYFGRISAMWMLEYIKQVILGLKCKV